MRGSLGLPKISRVGFETIDISKGCIDSADTAPASGAEPAAGGVEPADDAELAADSAEPIASVGLAISNIESAAGVGSGETVARSVDNAGAGVAKRSFEVSSGRSGRDRGRILIISLISSFLESSRINPSNNIINNSGVFIIIIISFKKFLNSFKSK